MKTSSVLASSSSDIQAVFFDLGDVLLKIDWPKVSKDLGMDEHGEEFKVFLTEHEGEYDRYERGLVSTEEFFAIFKEKYHLKKEIKELLKGWESIVKGPVEGIESVIEDLDPSLPIFIASNISENMMGYLFKPEPMYPFLKKFKKVFSSCEMHERKPETQFFLKAAKESGFQPEHILFIDDREENVEGAKKSGFKGEVCKHSSEDLRKILGKYGLLRPKRKSFRQKDS